MDKKVKGSWLIHHTHKLQGITSQTGYQNTFLAGKAGVLLSAISADNEVQINNDRLNVLATAANINTVFELPKLIDVLKERELIDKSTNGIAVLGVTTAAVLQHTSDIFESLQPNSSEQASIILSERASLSPVLVTDVSEELADTYKISGSNLNIFLNDAEKIGFVDTEKLGISGNEKLFFNGNLFRRETAAKMNNVLRSLHPDEQRKLSELTEVLRKSSCVAVDIAEKILGKNLFQKVASIGLFDINVVSNSNEEVGFLTLPSAFSKFSNSMIEDAFDLAKAFVSSITYGMTKSYHERGQIRMVEALLTTLVKGEGVGPVSAISQDYKVLELKGVVQVYHGNKKGRSGPMMKLLKKEVGELALQAIKQGDVSEYSLTELPTAAVTIFSGPEHNRERQRRRQIKINPKATNDMLTILRTGGGL